MSFILDALKKSEIERQRQTVPGLMDTQIAQRRRRLPLRAWGLGGLLAVNLIVLVFVLSRGGKGAGAVPGAGASVATTSRGATGAPPAKDPAVAGSADHFSPLDGAPVYAPEIPVPAADDAVSPSPAARTAMSGGAAVAHAASPHESHRHDPLLTDADTAADNDEVLPAINEINLTGPDALPELHLDVHVYASRPTERFVYINMRKYHEGATLQEGPVLEHIRRDGAVLNFHGLRFLLPRQS